MEENLKKCKALLGSDRWVLGTQDKQAIENLIKGYEKLEKRNKRQFNLLQKSVSKKTIKTLKEENEKKIDAMRQFKHSSPFDFGLLNGIDDCCRTLLGENLKIN